MYCLRNNLNVNISFQKNVIMFITHLASMDINVNTFIEKSGNLKHK